MGMMATAVITPRTTGTAACGCGRRHLHAGGREFIDGGAGEAGWIQQARRGLQAMSGWSGISTEHRQAIMSGERWPKTCKQPARRGCIIPYEIPAAGLYRSRVQTRVETGRKESGERCGPAVFDAESPRGEDSRKGALNAHGLRGQRAPYGYWRNMSQVPHPRRRGQCTEWSSSAGVDDDC